MILWLSMRWWYGNGFVWMWHNSIVSRLEAWTAYFSAESLMKTLFAPYKQTFADGGSGNVGVAFRAWVDRTISRFVGVFIRTSLIIAWMVCSLSVLITGFIGMLLWPFIPIFPLLSIIVLAVRS